MAEKVLIAVSTFPDQETARGISNELVTKKFAACANILPAVESIYRWKEKIESGNETLVLFKLSEDRQSAFLENLRSLHPYDVPENYLRSNFERAARIFALGYGKLQLAAPTFLANEINCDADRIRNSGHGDDFHGETKRARHVDNRVDGEKNRGERDEKPANR